MFEPGKASLPGGLVWFPPWYYPVGTGIPSAGSKLVYSSTFEGHLVRLETVLQRLREAGLKVKVEKCHFLQSKVKFLGHVVSAYGVSTDPDKVSAVKTVANP